MTTKPFAAVTVATLAAAVALFGAACLFGQNYGDCQSTAQSSGMYCDKSNKQQCVVQGCQPYQSQGCNGQCGIPGCTHALWLQSMVVYFCSTGADTDTCTTCNPRVCAQGQVAHTNACSDNICIVVAGIYGTCQPGGGGLGQ